VKQGPLPKTSAAWQNLIGNTINPDDQWPATKEETNKAFSLVAMAASAGGLAALSLILANLPENFPPAVAVVQVWEATGKAWCC
jgi:chemotaxis response regulator CheB